VENEKQKFISKIVKTAQQYFNFYFKFFLKKKTKKIVKILVRLTLNSLVFSREIF